MNCIIAKSPSELINEGSILHHCVGNMGYDQKVVDEKSLIFFIRTKDQPDTPLVTVEYSMDNFLLSADFTSSKFEKVTTPGC
ncbi:MAG: PcfJ domain-containing protein [Clostridia bacterium]|nr:PcfJ domain-containing protein [Clostridia bacterium]